MPALIPDAATYGAQQSYATQAYQKAKSNIQGQQQGWLKQYGMTADYDQNNGSYNNYRVDPNNQFGLVQQNRTSEAMDLNAAQDNAIGRGIGGAGLGNQQAGQLHYQHGVQDTNLGNTFMQGMGQFGSQLSDSANTYQQALFQAENDAIQKALANQQFQSYYPGEKYTDNSTDQQDYTTPPTGQQLSPQINPKKAQTTTPYLKAVAKAVKANPQTYVNTPGKAQVSEIRKAVAASVAQTASKKKTNSRAE